MHLNIQGLQSKFDDFKILLSQLQENDIVFDVILLCETFLNDSNAKLYDLPGYNFEYKNRQKLKKGGVCIYIRKTLNYKLLTDLSLFEEGEFESIFVELSSSEPIIVGEIYRVPDTNQILSLERYETILNKIEQTRLRAIIGTDQNFDYLKIDSNKVTSDLLDLYIYNNMLPMITKPTRVAQTTATLIDNIYVNNNSNCVQSGIMYVKYGQKWSH
jgi:exonuclease III